MMIVIISSIIFVSGIIAIVQSVTNPERTTLITAVLPGAVIVLSQYIDYKLIKYALLAAIFAVLLLHFFLNLFLSNHFIQSMHILIMFNALITILFHRLKIDYNLSY